MVPPTPSLGGPVPPAPPPMTDSTISGVDTHYDHDSFLFNFVCIRVKLHIQGGPKKRTPNLFLL